MNPIKIIHLADVHFSPDHKEEALASLNVALDKGKDEGVDLFVIAGDLFDRAIQNTANSGLPELQQAIQRMMDNAPVIVVTGTPTHDVRGCYEILRKTHAAHSFTILDPHRNYYLVQGDVYSGNSEHAFGPGPQPELLILGCPEPGKEQFLAGKRMGRDEANEAIITGMRSMLMGFGAVRKEHPDIPCLFVYHGNVAGATMCNGQAIRPGEITIGRDDLAMVGADYYALGHIHLAQQIGNLPAYYAGSAYPVNWGELDQKGFYVVGLSDERLIRTRIPFPHPPRKKIVMESVDYEIVGDDEGSFVDYQTWEVIRGTKEEIATINVDEELATLIKAGALPGSKVTTEIIPTETVRAGHIQEAKKLAQKVAIYAENSGDDIQKHEKRWYQLLEKADALEAEAKAAGETGEGLHVLLDKLGLRGAWGIWKGQGKDEIWLDMKQYDPGLIVLADANGAGKTTLFGNLHIFPELLVRPGKLQDHFRLRDSFRDLYFTDERTGDKYRAFIQIDGQNASGKCEYHLYKNGQPLTDGRRESYVIEIMRLYGSKALFLRGGLVLQKATKDNPDLAEATKGEKRGIFRELGGLDYQQAYADSAKAKEQALEGEILHDQGNLEMVEKFATELPGKKVELRSTEHKAKEATETLEESEKLGAKIKANVAKLEVELNEQRDVERRLNEASVQEAESQSLIETLTRDKETDQQAIDLKPKAEKEISDYESFQKEEGRLGAKKTEILEKREGILAEHGNEKATAEAARQEIRPKRQEKEAEVAVLRQHRAVCLVQIEKLIEETETPLDENCPTCGQVLPEGKLDVLRDEREGKLAKLIEVQAQEVEAEKGIATAEKDIADCDSQLAAIVDPEEPELVEFDDSLLDTIQVQIAALDIDSARGWLQKAQEAQGRIDEGNKRIGDAYSKLGELAAAMSDLEGKLDPELESRYNQAEGALDIAREDYAKARDDVTRLEVEKNNLQAQVETLEKASQDVYKIRQSIKEKQAEQADWSYLARACGPDGIQALELDAMAPSIEELANRFLAIICEANPWDAIKRKGCPFDQVDIQTTREGGSGSKKRQIEDFQIFVHDLRDDTWEKFAYVSGGEEVWVKRAIYDAFGIVRDRNTDQRFLTVMQDEADGGLDPKARLAFFKVLEAAHQESGRRHSIIITHSESAQEMIAQRISMTELDEKADKE